MAGKSDARTNKQAGQPNRPTGPLQGTERETFTRNETLSNQLPDGTVAEIQKQIYSEGLGAYEGRAANALKTLSNSALSTGSAFSRTSEGLRGEASGPQAVAMSRTQLQV